MIKLYRFLYWVYFVILVFHIGVYFTYCFEYIFYDIVAPPLDILKACIMVLLASVFMGWCKRKIKQARDRAIVEYPKND